MKVLWDVENVQCEPTLLKRAIEQYLADEGRRVVRSGVSHDRIDITAFHDPRRAGALTAQWAGDFVALPGRLIDTGSKHGAADIALANDARQLARDVEHFGLRVSEVVIVSTDSDFATSGVYDEVRGAGIDLIVVHNANIKPPLKRLAEPLKKPCLIFVSLPDLLGRLAKVGPAVEGAGAAASSTSSSARC